MSDLERRLRDTLHGAAEQAPAGLIEAVRRRHRRHQIRTGAGLAAVVAAVAIAVPPVAGALRAGGSGGHGQPPLTGGTSQTSTPGARGGRAPAPGTVLIGCANSNVGALGRHWKTPASFHAGQFWVVPESVSGGSQISRQGGQDAVRLYVAIVVLDGLRPGSVVVVRASQDRGDLRFLYSRNDALNPSVRYTMRSGEAGVTFVSCAPRQQTFPAPYTDYLGAYLIRGARCVPAHVWIAGRRQPAVLRLGACQGH